MSKPTIRRAGKKLICLRGSWRSATHYAYAWLITGHVRHGTTTGTLAITHGLRGHRIACRVTASNAAGSATATSRAVTIH
jgi:hypothetical protein